jgi:hypothetical protein
MKKQFLVEILRSNAEYCVVERALPVNASDA